MNDSLHIVEEAPASAHDEAEALLAPRLEVEEPQVAAPRKAAAPAKSAAVQAPPAPTPRVGAGMPTPGGVPYALPYWAEAVKAAKEQTAASAKATPKAEADTAATDTAPAAAPRFGMLIEPAQKAAPAPLRRSAESDVSSWIILGLVVLFLLVALRFRRNFRYLHNLVHEMTSVRRRRNMFTDTVRETMFVTLMNVLCIVSVGLWVAWAIRPAPAAWAPGTFPPDLWPCLGVVAVYYGAQWIAYSCIGGIFLKDGGTRLWLQGFRSGQGLLGLLLFPLAMVALFWPASLAWLLVAALILYFGARCAFIIKGFKIFYAQRSSYLLFLYYLCGVEIVPVLLVWRAARAASDL